MFKVVETWTVGGYTIHEYDDSGRALFAFELGSEYCISEYYDSLDMALIAMVGEKYTSRRGAGGEGVGTAADWFAKMIGLTPAS